MDEDELLRAAAEVLLRRASQRSAPSLTVAELFAKFEAAHSSRPNWWATRDKTIAFVRAHADRDCTSLTIQDWTKHALARLATLVPGKLGAAGRCYGKSTVNVELGSAKTLLYWGVEQGLIRYNPIAKAKILKNRKGRETAPKEHEVQRALACCRIPEQVVMVLAAADVCLRRNEIRQLQHEWIDHERKLLSLPGWAAKGGRGGIVPLTQRFLDAVSDVPRHIRDPHVMVSPKGGPYSGVTLDKWWQQIRACAGLVAAPGDRTVRLHDCRAGGATNALDRGVRLETVSRRLLRHSNLATTEIYLRGKDVGNLDQAIEAMEAGILRDQRRAKRIEAPESKLSSSVRKPE